jgi:hypothetical protein
VLLPAAGRMTPKRAMSGNLPTCIPETECVV